MKITALMENTPVADGFYAEHGLSLYIETDAHRILFDMGPTEHFLANAERLAVDLAGVDIAVLSHAHYDHGGGLQAFLRVNSSAPVYVSQYAFDACCAGDGRYIGIDPALRGHPRLRMVGERLALGDGLEIIACNGLERAAGQGTSDLYVQRDGALQVDSFRHEQYLMIHENGRKVAISGCSHKGVLNIMGWLQPDVLVGGFHFMNMDPQGEEREALTEAAQGLLAYDATYYTCHCTGLAPYAFLQEKMGKRLSYLAAGQSIEL